MPYGHAEDRGHLAASLVELLVAPATSWLLPGRASGDSMAAQASLSTLMAATMVKAMAAYMAVRLGKNISPSHPA